MRRFPADILFATARGVPCTLSAAVPSGYNKSEKPELNSRKIHNKRDISISSETNLWGPVKMRTKNGLLKTCRQRADYQIGATVLVRRLILSTFRYLDPGFYNTSYLPPQPESRCLLIVNTILQHHRVPLKQVYHNRKFQGPKYGCVLRWILRGFQGNVRVLYGCFSGGLGTF